MGAIPLGQFNGQTVWATPEQRETHFHIMGNSRMGKSSFMEHMIRRDIIAGNGVCVIDPHGTMYDSLVDWLAVSGAGNHRQVHLINPAEDGWSVGFNPLCAGDTEPAVRVDMMVDACRKVWGEGDEAKPLLGRCLRLIFFALAEHGLSIVDARRLSTRALANDRLELTETLSNSDIAADWAEMNSYSPREFGNHMLSTNNRLLEFTTNPRVKRLMGQTQGLIDFKQCMDDRHIVLVNLAGKGRISDADAQTIGAMLFADLFFCAKLRDRAVAAQNPFYCYVDECADYITEHVAKSLDQTAKFGLHLTLAHHRMSQLMHYGPAFAEAVMTGAQNKVIFRLDHDDAAEELARHLFRREFDLEQRKELTAPVTVGHTITNLFGYGRTHQQASVAGSGEMAGSGSGINSGTTDGESFFDPNTLLTPLPTGRMRSSVEAGGTSSSKSWATNTFQAQTEGESVSETQSQALQPIIEERGLPKPFEEVLHEAIVTVRTLPRRQMLVYLPDQPRTLSMRSPDLVPARPVPGSIADTVTRLSSASTYTHAATDIDAAIAERQGSDALIEEDDDLNDEDAQFRFKPTADVPDTPPMFFRRSDRV